MQSFRYTTLRSGLSLCVVSPEKPRYKSSAPVVVLLPQGPVVAPHPAFAPQGFITVFFAFPGGSVDGNPSTGTRSRSEALAEVLTFAKTLGTNVGLIGQEAPELAWAITPTGLSAYDQKKPRFTAPEPSRVYFEKGLAWEQAAACELADRTQAKSWEARLTKTLFRAPRTLSVRGPWQSDLWLYRLTDHRPDRPQTLVERAGVPCLATTKTGELLAVFQWFPEDDDAAFDQVALMRSQDAGKSWSKPTPLRFEGLPDGWQRPFDPTLVVLPDQRLRLYFSTGPNGTVGTGSALSTDGVTFRVEPGLRIEQAARPIVDPAVAFFAGKWHLINPEAGPRPALHSVSTDGLRFTRLPDLPTAPRRSWTGNLVVVEDRLRFYGSGEGGIWWRESVDGTTWSEPVSLGLFGGDPGMVVQGKSELLMALVSPPLR